MYTISKMFFLTICIPINHSFQISDFVVDYFVQKNTHSANIFVCNKLDAVSIHLAFQRGTLPFLVLIHSADFKYNNHSLINMMNTDLHTLGIFIDLSCKAFHPLIEEVFSKITSNCCYNIVFWNETGIGNQLREDYLIPFGTEVMCAILKEKTIFLYKVEILMHTTPFLKKVGYWNSGIFVLENKHGVNNNLQNQIIRGILSFTDQNTKNNSAVMVRNDTIANLELSTLAHFSLNIYGCLQKMYNFQWELNTIYGLGLLMNHRNTFLNVSVNSFDFLITTENQISEFGSNLAQLPSIKSIRQCIQFRHPPVYSYITFYLKPFSFLLWVCLAAFLIVSSVLLYIMCLLQFEDIDYNELSIFGNILYCLGALINQGLSVPSARNSKRIVQFNILQLSLFVSNFYSAIIINYLLYPTHNIINNFDDIIKEGFDIGIENTTYNNITFSIEYFNNLSTNIQHFSSYYDVSTGVEKLRTSKFAFLSIDSNINTRTSEYFTDIEICELSTVPLNNDYKLLMYLKKMSPYKELFQKGTLLLKETGIVSREDKVWNKRSPKCSGTVKYIEIGLTEISFACIIFIFGFTYSILIFLLEMIHAKYHHIWNFIM